MASSRRSVVRAVGALLLAACPSSAAAGGQLPWPMAGGGPTHAATADGPRPPLRRAWSAPVGAAAGPAVATDRVVVVGGDVVAAFASDTGKRLWEVSRIPAPTGPPALTEGLVVYGEGPREDGDEGDRGSLVAVSLEDGSPVWRRDLRSPAVAGPAASEDRVFAATRFGEVVAIEAATGRTVWRVDAPGRVETSPAVAEGAVVVVAEDYDVGTVTVLALDAATGARRWRSVPEGIALGSTAATVVDGVVVLGTGDLRLRGLRLRDGAELWTLPARAAFGARFTPAGGAGAIVGDRAGHVHAVDPRTGRERWLYRIPGDLLLGGPAVLASRWVAVGDGAGNVSVIDARTGHLAWTRDLGERRIEALAADGARLYAAQRGGPLTAFVHDPEGVLLDEPSPTTLFPVRAVGAWALAAVPLYLAILLLFRWVRSRRAEEPTPAAQGPPKPEGWRG